MKAPLSWLKEYVDINVSSKEFAEAMTMSGSKVEAVEYLGEEINRVVTGKIISLEKHPDADKLQVCQVEVSEGVIQIVTGAKNIALGDIIPVALNNSKLPGGKKITKGKLRGVESNGMLCSIQELELTKEDYPEAAEDGIFILPVNTPIGIDINKIIGKDETVVEFEITSNRPDCLSMVGLAREASVTLGTSFRMPEVNVKGEAGAIPEGTKVEILAPDLCPRYAARVVKNVKIGSSPEWMRQRLKSAGVRPINNIVDITNYVMLEMGQPMHAFDFDNLAESTIIVRKADEGEILETLDGQNRILDSTMLVIADAKRAVAVAGVMGGANTEVSDSTKTILFESANFNGVSVRLSAKKLGMRTEASGRFEKGLDVENVTAALNRAVQLVELFDAGEICQETIDVYPGKSKANQISFRPEKVNSFLGTDISTEKMVEIFKKLDIETDLKEMKVTIPSFRADLEGEADLAEEVARFYNYNNIKATLLQGRASTVGRKTPRQQFEDEIKRILVANGMYEIYTYSFTSPKVFERLGIPADNIHRNTVKIMNPLGEDFSIMRTTTAPEMLEAMARNYNRRNESGNFFEIGNIYIPNENQEKLPTEKQILTLGMYGGRDFYDMKGVIEEIFNNLGIKERLYSTFKNAVILHPGRAAEIIIKNNKVGVMGEVHPDVVSEFDGPERMYIAILEMDVLFNNANRFPKYKQLPKYPAVSRDIAMLVKDEVQASDIENAIKNKSKNLIENVKLFDVYKGKQVAEGMKSMAWSITFRAEDRTLTDDEVQKVMIGILEELKNSTGAQLRE
jgi:phenylalanyl-tRNA synthetase beta chain